MFGALVFIAVAVFNFVHLSFFETDTVLFPMIFVLTNDILNRNNTTIKIVIVIMIILTIITIITTTIIIIKFRRINAGV